MQKDYLTVIYCRNYKNICALPRMNLPLFTDFENLWGVEMMADMMYYTVFIFGYMTSFFIVNTIS